MQLFTILKQFIMSANLYNASPGRGLIIPHISFRSNHYREKYIFLDKIPQSMSQKKKLVALSYFY